MELPRSRLLARFILRTCDSFTPVLLTVTHAPSVLLAASWLLAHRIDDCRGHPAQCSYLQEKGVYSEVHGTVGFTPERGNRYAYNDVECDQ